MNLQIESSSCSNRARVYRKINQVYESLPNEFKAGEVEKLCGFSTYPLHRTLVASVLSSDFKCRNVGENGKRHWVKP